ncbi:hypothetical protein Dimus_031371, partial [Dionaea muscipula]
KVNRKKEKKRNEIKDRDGDGKRWRKSWVSESIDLRTRSSEAAMSVRTSESMVPICACATERLCMRDCGVAWSAWIRAMEFEERRESARTECNGGQECLGAHHGVSKPRKPGENGSRRLEHELEVLGTIGGASAAPPPRSLSMLRSRNFLTNLTTSHNSMRNRTLSRTPLLILQVNIKSLKNLSQQSSKS